MPKRMRYNYVGQGRMRVMKKRRIFKKSYIKVPRTMSYGGKYTYATLTWSQTLSVVEGTPGVGTVYAFNLNSAYDPNRTGVGNQPSGFDQMMAMYRRCLVYSATFEWAVSNTTIGAPTVVGFWTGPDTAAPISPEAYPNVPGGQMTIVGQANGMARHKFWKRVNFAKELGVPMSKILSEDDYAHPVNANPAVPLLAYIWIRGFAGGNAATVSGIIRIVMKCKFYDSKVLEVS